MTQPASPATASLRLRVIASMDRELIGREIPLTVPTVWIGRDDDCDVVVGDTSISRRHARLEVSAAGGVVVHDNGSANGVVVGGQRVAEAQVLPGHRFTLGGSTFELVAGDGAPTPDQVPHGTVAISQVADLVAGYQPPRPLDQQREAVLTADRQVPLSDPSSMPVVAAEKEMAQPASPTTASLRLRVIASMARELIDREIPLTAPTVWIGRDDGCDVVVGDTSISRRHARLEVSAAGQVMVHDNSSAHGVVVSGRRVEEAEVPPGHRFTLGGSTFELVAGDIAPPPAVPHGTVAISQIADLVAQFETPRSLDEQGEAVIATANRPMVLSDPNSMWVVTSGKVEIFTVALENGEPSGRRTHFLTVEPGEAFFGLDSDRFGYDSGFLAVGKAGSELRRYALDQLQRLALIPAHRERVAALVAGWVAGLSRRLTADLDRVPTPEIGLAVGGSVEVASGKIAAAAADVAWVELPAANFLYDGMAGLSYEVEGVLFPLAPGAWIELLARDEKITLDPKTTIESIRDARLWAGLDAFHRVLCECEFLNKKFDNVDEFLRLGRKAEAVEKAREVALGAIGSVLGGTQIWEPAAGGTEVEPVLRACELVAKPLHIRVRNHPNARPDRSFEETVLDVATASRFRIRRVKLSDSWWQHDQGPFLGQWEESKAPVALRQTARKWYQRRAGYECVDPASGERFKVTAEVASSLHAFAFTFYAPFPDGALEVGDVVRFGLRSLKPEFRTLLQMGIGVGLLSTVIPLITGKVFDTAIPQAERSLLYQFGLGLFLVALTSSAFKITQSVAVLRLQGKMDYSVQAAVWDRLLDLPLSFFRRFSAGDLADRAAGVDKIRSIVAGAGVAAILGSFASLFNAAQMMVYSFTLAGVGVAFTLLYVILTTTANYVQLRLQREEMWLQGSIAGRVLQLISGVSKLRVSGAENHAFRTWATDFAEMRRVSFRIGRVHNLVAVLNSGVPVLSAMAIFFTMAYLKKGAVERGEVFELTTGDFLAFNAAFGIFMAAMQALGEASLNLLEMVPIYERLKPMLTTESEVDDTKAAPGQLRGEIEVAHVHFRYLDDGPLVLKDVSIKIRAGEFVALVGGSGSGKSTLMRVMLGFENPGKGSVYYDGQDLSTLDLRMVRQQIGVVLQDSRLLPADIFRNIVGASSRTVQDAWDAARKAGLADDIKMMPMGMHTYVTEGGGSFSGGQKQRLMIARAVVHRPRILFLDEATSALDNRTQAIVTDSLDQLQATRIVIAHRLSTIVNADRIYYLDNGTVAEYGTYQELMDQDGLFAQLAKRQLA